LKFLNAPFPLTKEERGICLESNVAQYTIEPNIWEIVTVVYNGDYHKFLQYLTKEN
jgi:hypothetical protein